MRRWLNVFMLCHRRWQFERYGLERETPGIMTLFDELIENESR
jgi:hypothetical protein